MPGKPDIAFPKAKTAIFCDSEFWHGYHWSENQEKILSNREYWIPKIERNMKRDKSVSRSLRKQGWLVLRFWGKAILKNPGKCADRIEKAIAGRQRTG
jgi:DNA mismatch endonuclease (patch repair protein)